MEVAGKKVLVMGAGRSGVAAARFLAARGAVVALNDQKPVEEWSNESLALKAEGVGFVGGEIPSWLLDQIELIVLSPGVPPKIIPVRYAERAGAEVIGEVELAWRYLRGRVVAVTGTNGKTTTTTLIGELLRDAGIPVQVGGNIGTPLVSLVDSSTDDGWTLCMPSNFISSRSMRTRSPPSRVRETSSLPARKNNPSSSSRAVLKQTTCTFKPCDHEETMASSALRIATSPSV